MYILCWFYDDTWTRTSLSLNGPALGAQAGEARISQVVKAGGFKHFTRATHTPFNIVYEAKPYDTDKLADWRGCLYVV